MTMDDLRTPETDRVVQARALLAAAAEGVKRLESAANQALYRFFSLTGMMARIETLAGSPAPDAADAAALDAALVCRETKVLLHYIDAHGTGTAAAAPVLETVPLKPSANGPAPSRNGHGGRDRGAPPFPAGPPDAHIRAERR
jgi:hypothetical protein